MQPLKRYWFKFEISKGGALGVGCGVSAYDYDDAIKLMCERIFGMSGLPPIEQCIENVVISTLEASHVHPNMGSVNVRGIWFPQGYDEH
jgi:hypothetical protein